MPIYEYRCDECRKRAQLFFRSFSAVGDPICPSCGSTRMTKLVSRVVTIRSEESRLESLADPSSFAGLDEDDPKSIAAWARRMGSEMGEDLGDDFDEMVDAIERGEDPMGGEGGEDAGGLGGGMDDFGSGADDF